MLPKAKSISRKEKITSNLISRVSEPRHFLSIMSDREDDVPVIVHQDPDNLPVDLAELDNPTLSDDELDPQGKHIASVLSCTPTLVPGFSNWVAL